MNIVQGELTALVAVLGLGCGRTAPYDPRGPSPSVSRSTASDAGDGGAVDAGDGEATDAGDGQDAGGLVGADFCVTAPWLDAPASFTAADGETTFPPGTYTLRYVGGAQIHDPREGYEVTAHYQDGPLQAGHHLYNGDSPETGTTNVWLDVTGTVDGLPSVAAVESANAGHTWTFQHGGGPLFITYIDDYYGDNQGPGTRLCIRVPAP